jgi:hypothetical protein
MRAFRLCLVLLSLPIVAAATPDFQWVRTHDGGGSYTDDGRLVLTDPQGNLILGGVSHDGVDGLDLTVQCLAKTDGALLWETRQTAFDTNDMAISDMSWDGLGDLIVAGFVVGCVG